MKVCNLIKVTQVIQTLTINKTQQSIKRLHRVQTRVLEQAKAKKMMCLALIVGIRMTVTVKRINLRRN